MCMSTRGEAVLLRLRLPVSETTALAEDGANGAQFFDVALRVFASMDGPHVATRVFQYRSDVE